MRGSSSKFHRCSFLPGEFLTPHFATCLLPPPCSFRSLSFSAGYFSDGVTEEILHRLSATRALHVFGSTSSFAFRNSEDSPARISEALGVEYLLHGSIRRDNNYVRITARLLDQQGLQVWSQSFDRKLEAIFVIQSEIASAVAGDSRTNWNESSSARFSCGLARAGRKPNR